MKISSGGEPLPQHPPKKNDCHPVIQSFNIADTETNTGHCQPLIPFAIQLLVATSPALHFHRNGNVACMFLHNLCHSIRHCWFLNSTVLIPGRYCKGGSHCPEIWPRKCLEESGIGFGWNPHESSKRAIYQDLPASELGFTSILGTPQLSPIWHASLEWGKNRDQWWLVAPKQTQGVQDLA